MEVRCRVFANILINVYFMGICYICVLIAVTIWIFIWFGGIVPTCEKSFWIIGVSDRGVYLFACIVGVMECFFIL